MLNARTLTDITTHIPRLLTGLVLAMLAAGCQIAPIEPPQSPLPTAQTLATPGSPAATAEEVRFASGDLALAGTLLLPPGPGPHPAVLFLTGSGPQDRDNAMLELLPGYQPYGQFAEALAQQGIASLRFDDRGVGGSEGEMAAAVSSELLADADAALGYLRSRDEIDPERIGVLGHSQGGVIAAMLAAAHPEIEFVIALATPALDGYETVKDSLSRLAETTGLPAEQVEPAAERELRSMDLALAQEWDALEAHLRASILENLEQIPEDQRDALGNLDDFVDTHVDGALQTYRSERFRDEITLDPAPAWEQVDASVLALYAAHETTVFAEAHAPALAAHIASLPDMTIATLPGVNHLFLEAGDGNLQRFLQEAAQGADENMTRVPDRVVDRIVDWVQARVEPAP